MRIVELLNTNHPVEEFNKRNYNKDISSSLHYKEAMQSALICDSGQQLPKLTENQFLSQQK